MKELTRKEKERLQRKEYILDAATDLFSKQGYDNTTIDEIAKKSEFSKGSIYQYFKSKEEIYTTIFERMVNEITTLISGIINEDTQPLDKIKAVINTSFHFAYENQQLAKMIIIRNGDYSDNNNKIHCALDKKLDKKYSHMIADAIEHKQITKGDAETLDIILDGMFFKSIHHLIINDCPKEKYTKFANTISEVFFHGCC